MNNEIKNAIDAFIEKEYSFCKKKKSEGLVKSLKGMLIGRKKR